MFEERRSLIKLPCFTLFKLFILLCFVFNKQTNAYECLSWEGEDVLEWGEAKRSVCNWTTAPVYVAANHFSNWIRKDQAIYQILTIFTYLHTTVPFFTFPMIIHKILKLFWNAKENAQHIATTQKIYTTASLISDRSTFCWTRSFVEQLPSPERSGEENEQM